MDLSCSGTTLHPQAYEILFKYYPILLNIFRDVLGHLELDYISINILTPKHELLMLSSRPAIEQNLIDKYVWQDDMTYSLKFIENNTPQTWDSLYNEKSAKILRYHKQEVFEYSLGLSIPSSFQELRVVYSFAIKSKNRRDQEKLINNTEILCRMGRFCLQRIIKAIPLPDLDQKVSTKPTLRLIINNKEHHENIT